MKIEAKYKIIKILLLLIYIVAVSFCLCYNFKGNNAFNIPSTIWGIPSDKVIHFFLFLPAPVLAFAAFHNKNIPKSFLIVFVSTLTVAAIFEYAQRYTGYRTSDMIDFVANAAGIGAGTILSVILYHIWH